MQTLLEPVRLLTRSPNTYAIRLARDVCEVKAAQALRFAVFNLELNEGLAESFATGLDADPFDDICEHLLVEHIPTGEVVGTYRLQTGTTAANHRGYYSEQEFDFRPFEAVRGQLIELGRACVHHQHRNLVVLGLLWKGIADYARERGGRYLCGCSSMTSQDPAVGASAYADLCRRHLVELRWRTQPLPIFDCPLDRLADEPPKIPKLLRAYLSIGARICGPPALDRHFKTIDFLTLLDLHEMPAPVRARFLS
ncbi:MAG: GNAT family N-acetyltransferase [Verrucomicrobia subdivision 3 bacterium]|nr:GNAT family N-acetyltransferase [Limisphaerales bacterium]